MVKNGDIKCVHSEGMPTYRNPFEKGKLVIQFSVNFPERLEPEMARKLEKILPAKYVLNFYDFFLFQLSRVWSPF